MNIIIIMLFLYIFIMLISALGMFYILKDNQHFNEQLYSDNESSYKDDIEFMNLYNECKSFCSNDEKINISAKKRKLYKKLSIILALLFVLLMTLSLFHILPNFKYIGFIFFTLLALANVFLGVMLFEDATFATLTFTTSYGIFVKKIFNNTQYINKSISAIIYKENSQSQVECEFISPQDTYEDILPLKHILESYANSNFTYWNYIYEINIGNAIVDEEKNFSFSIKMAGRPLIFRRTRYRYNDYLAIIENHNFQNCHYTYNMNTQELKTNELLFLDSLYKKYGLKFDLNAENGKVFLRIFNSRQSNFTLFYIPYFKNSKNIENYYLSYLILKNIKNICEEISNYKVS